jgi:hypothetical protein
LLVAYIALVVILGRTQAGIDRTLPSLRELQTGSGGWLANVALFCLADVALLAPVGLLSILATRSPERRHDFLRLALSAAIVLLAAAISRAAAEDPPRLAGGAPELLVPLLGGVLGIGAGMAWCRGRAARRVFFSVLAALVVIAVAGGVGALYAAAQEAPVAIEAERLTSAEKRRLYRLFQLKTPRSLSATEMRTLQLTTRDLNLLLAWALPAGPRSPRARVTLAGDAVELGASTRVPGPGADPRYLNVAARGRFTVEGGRLAVNMERLRVGRVEVPRWILGVSSRLAARAVAADHRVRSLLTAVRTVRVDGSILRVTYGHAELPRDLVADMFHPGHERSAVDESVRAQVARLVEIAGRLPKGDGRTGGALQAAFALARERSEEGTAVQENGAAIIALGILLGHWRIEHLIGPFMDQPQRQAVSRAFRSATLRGRRDWSQHFFVSAALTVLAARGVSDAAGLFKEELDADGGSGFSFADLLADRAGTTFAVESTRDEASARRMQDRLAGGFRVEDYFPRAHDLPEDITDAELQRVYGGVGGSEYLRLVAEIERRIEGCAAYAIVR